MFKKYLISIFILSSFLTFSYANASFIDDTKVSIKEAVGKDLSKNLTREQFFNFLGDNYVNDLPKSYKYINLNFRDIKKGTKLYENLQKMVYIDAIENKSIYISPKKIIDALSLYKISEKAFASDILDDSDLVNLIGKKADLSDILVILTLINELNSNDGVNQENLTNTSNLDILDEKFKIFNDVYETLLNSHYNKANLSKDDIIYSAIEGLAAGTGDKFTTYFPPVEKKAFSDTLAGEYEGIGSYVDMLKAGEFRIVAPLSGSPAEKAGLKANDMIIKVDDFEIAKDTTLDEAVSKIKGKAGTKVKLTIKRGNETLIIEVERAKITLKDVEGKSLDEQTYYMNIRIFGDHLLSDFQSSLADLKTKTQTKKLIIDLRNNPGGYLEQVSDLLSYFVEKNLPVAVVKYNNGLEQIYSSAGYNAYYDFSKLKIVILQNGGSASASEIMVGTLKDYYPNLTIMGEKSYGKGSVQTIKTYYDGSSLKYTIAHWFTGKTETGIDGTGIKPDIEVKLDEEKTKASIDNQLEEAKKL